MSNTKAKQNGHYSLAKYRAEAKGEPFVLDVDAETSIVIPRPTGDVMWDLEEAVTSREVIALLCGDKTEEFTAAIGGEDFEVVNMISEDMRKHFAVGEYRASRG